MPSIQSKTASECRLDKTYRTSEVQLSRLSETTKYLNRPSNVNSLLKCLWKINKKQLMYNKPVAPTWTQLYQKKSRNTTQREPQEKKKPTLKCMVNCKFFFYHRWQTSTICISPDLHKFCVLPLKCHKKVVRTKEHL